MNMFTIVIMVVIMITILFYMASKKEKMDLKKTNVFECGFSSYFYSRFSFSIHYYTIGMIFLFLDLELCLMMPMMMDMEKSPKMKYTLSVFLISLMTALITEWKENKLEWKH